MSLVVDGLSVTKGGKSILSGVSFTAPSSAITGLVGPNGAGKSTLLNALFGIVPASGEARFGTDNLLNMPRRDRARRAAFVEQSASTEERLTVRDVVALGRIPFQSALSSTTAPEDKAIIDAVLDETGMSAFTHRRFDTLSGGEQQRVHIARALAQQPRLLVLDEPTSHLDISAQLQLLTLLHRRARAGTTIFLALHDLNLAARSCDHLVMLDGGTLLAEGSPERVLTPENLLQAYGVRARLLPDPVSARSIIVYDDATERATPHNPD